MNVRILSTQSTDFEAQFERLLDRGASQQANQPKAITQQVEQIIERVRTQGDEALIALTKQLDRSPRNTVRLTPQEIAASAQQVTPEVLQALTHSAERIRTYHQKQFQSDWSYQDELGVQLGQKITPMQSVGLYVPGGKAAYPSSVLMNAIPAQVAGVRRLAMVCPCPEGELNAVVLAAAHLLGIEEIYAVGGAQAVAALAYGTQSIERVDKIVGPGNAYVAEAKRQVFGQVGIDMIAGPSEVTIIADETASPDWMAMDLFSQAEHDEQAQVLLLSSDEAYLAKVQQSIERLLPTMERRAIIEASLQQHGALILTSDIQQSIELVNRIAPEHLELAFENARDYLDDILHAGAIFIGTHTPEVLGDYCIGTNHVLPTSGTARFSSPLGVYDFQKRTSVIESPISATLQLAPIAQTLAEQESLTAHAASAKYRLTESS